MSKMEITKEDKEKAIKDLKEGYIGLKEGQDVYCMLRHVSTSGMVRDIDFYIVGKDNTIWRITWSVAAATGYDYDRRNDAIRVQGVGMDMGFAVVARLSQVLFGDDYKLKHRWL